MSSGFLGSCNRNHRYHVFYVAQKPPLSCLYYKSINKRSILQLVRLSPCSLCCCCVSEEEEEAAAAAVVMALRPHCFVTNAFPSSYHHPNPKGQLLYLTNHQLLRSKFRLGQTVHFSAPVFPQMRMNAKEMKMVKVEFQESKGRKAQFVAERKERTQLPRYADDCGRVYQFSEFLSHPLGLESILNARAMQSFQNLDSNTFRCTLPNFQFFNFKLAPVMDLRVTPTSEDCTVELLSCKFEGSDDIKQRDDLLSVFMRNYITWDANSSEPTMDVDVKLFVTLEVSSLPFRLVPLSAIETPGNVIMKGLIDVYVPLLLQQMHEDYYKWVQEQSKVPL